MANSESGLIPALETALQAATTALDCAQLFDMPEIKAHAASVTRVSDYLGNLWRRGLVERLRGAKKADGRTRWMYQWRGNRMPSAESIMYSPKVLTDRPSMLITEEGGIMTIEMANLVISIRQKPTGSSYLKSLTGT
ncbi:MAG TPA: hypothetical protein PLB25_09425 [Rhodoferax sp.]|nr:hypothetical protein [Rhodoferax sp.]